MSGRTPLVGGNWKSHGGRDRMQALVSGLSEAKFSDGVDIVVTPTFLYLEYAKSALPARVQVGAQTCSADGEGAHTGTVSAWAIKDFGLNWVILGHSESRARLGAQANAAVSARLTRALDEGLNVILCCGESIVERKIDESTCTAFVASQLEACQDAIAGRWSQIVIAYEPIWAIGTGLTASPAQAQAMCASVRSRVPTEHQNAVRVLYGGSVKPGNAAELIAQPDIDGFLVGGASLKPADFTTIVNAAAPQ